MVKQKQIVLSNILLPVFIYKIYKKPRVEAIWIPNKAKKKKLLYVQTDDNGCDHHPVSLSSLCYIMFSNSCFTIQ